MVNIQQVDSLKRYEDRKKHRLDTPVKLTCVKEAIIL